jgi:Mor family transcriptional regulator
LKIVCEVIQINKEELLKHVDVSDISETYQPVVSLIGLYNFLKLCRYAMGDELYFPMQESVLRNTRKRLIIQEYNGCNVSELSRKYNLTPSQIRNIVKGSKLP